MKIKQTVLAASVSTAIAIGAIGEAAADVYAGSALDIDNLTIDISPSSDARVNSFNFTLENRATLNGVGGIVNETCSGSIGSNNCGAAPVLDAVAVNAPGSGTLRANNSMGFIGSNGTDYANSDSVINTAQLVNVGVAPTDTENVAEANLVTGTSASGSSEIQSTTGFTFSFTIDGTTPVELGSFELNFLADPDLMAMIGAGEAAGSSAQANLNTSFTLTQDTGVDGNGNGVLDFVNWNPQGTAANDCAASAGLICTEIADTQDLNINAGVSTSGSESRFSYGAGDLGFGDSLTAFGFRVEGLDAGTWTLTLNEAKSVSLIRSTEVPEPGILALAGIGLLGLGMTGLRRRRS